MKPQSEYVPIDSVLQDPENARLHSDKQLNYIAASLKRFGQQKPIVVGTDNVIIAGNGTHAAAKSILNWKEIWIVRSVLSAEEARAYSIADNQIPLHSEWDVDSLSKHLKDIADWNPMQDWASIGFSDDIVEPISEDSEDEENGHNSLLDFLENKPTDKKDKAIMAKPIKVTQEQWEVIDQAITIIKIQTADPKMSAGRALELMTADWLSGLAGYIEVEEGGE